MSKPNPSDPVLDPVFNRETAKLMQGAFKHRRQVVEAAEDLIIGMVGTASAVDAIKFKTPAGRNCMIVLAYGDEAVGVVTDLVEIVRPKLAH